MSELKFDKNVFNTGYALIYTILQYIFVLGFAFIILVLCLPANTFTIPDILLPIACAYLIASIAGFPIAVLVKKGFRRLLSSSKLSFDGNKIYYDKITDKLWTAVGGVEEHHIYNIDNIDSIKKSCFFYVIVGDIEETVINNGRQLEKKSIRCVKIPNAYAGMERMINHG